jgi:hypothetical protein
MGKTKRAGVWGKLRGLWKKWRGRRDYKGPTLSEDQVVDKFAEDLVKNVLWPLSPLILRQFVEEANKVGLPHKHLPYVFWLWVDQRSDWPSMHKGSAKALRFARDLVMSQGDMPNYRPATSPPPVEYEMPIDQILIRVGNWAYGKMRGAFARGLADRLQKWTPAMARATAATLPADKAGLYLQALFESYLEKRPEHFLDGYHLEQIVFGLMP